jgi:hypothetical protein
VIKYEVLLGSSNPETRGDVTPRQKIKRPRIEPAMGDAARNPKRKGGRNQNSREMDVDATRRDGGMNGRKEEDA